MRSTRLSLVVIGLVAWVSFQCGLDGDVISDPRPEDGISFNIQEVVLAETERIRLGRTQRAADFEPLGGLYLKPGQTVSVRAEDIQGSNRNPVILVGSYSRFEGFINPDEFPLTEGRETSVTNFSDFNAFLYVRYASSSPNSSCRLVVGKCEQAAYYEHGRTSVADFQEQVVNLGFTDVLLTSGKSTVVMSGETAQRYVNQDWEEWMTVLNRIIVKQDVLDGLDGSKPVHAPIRNRYFFTESNISNLWMAATYYRTMYSSQGAIDYLVDLEKLQKDGWGPWHELGHQHQLSAITWPEVVEVNVNVYSLVSEEYMGNESRLVRNSIWPELNLLYLNLNEQDKDFQGSFSVFWKLGLYQQLRIHYGDEFYSNLAKKIREEGRDIAGTEEKMAYFMLKASEVSGNDLRDFFRKWGFRLPESAYDAIAVLQLPPPAVDLTKLRED